MFTKDIFECRYKDLLKKFVSCKFCCTYKTKRFTIKKINCKEVNITKNFFIHVMSTDAIKWEV